MTGFGKINCMDTEVWKQSSGIYDKQREERQAT